MKQIIILVFNLLIINSILAQEIVTDSTGPKEKENIDVLADLTETPITHQHWY